MFYFLFQVRQRYFECYFRFSWGKFRYLTFWQSCFEFLFWMATTIWQIRNSDQNGLSTSSFLVYIMFSSELEMIPVCDVPCLTPLWFVCFNVTISKFSLQYQCFVYNCCYIMLYYCTLYYLCVELCKFLLTKIFT